MTQPTNDITTMNEKLAQILEALQSITALLSLQTQLRGHSSKNLSDKSEKIKTLHHVPLALDSLESHQPTLERALHNLRIASLEHEGQHP